MAQPTQLTPTEQDALVKQIGLAMLRVAPEDWEQLTVDYRAVGRYAESTGQVVYSDGATDSWTMPADLQSLFARLRAGMYREGRGTWFNARYRLDHPSSYNLEYDREEPVWDGPPPPQAYPDDLRLFPRSDDNVPDWLRRRLATAPPPPGPPPGTPPAGPPRFRVARIFDGPGEDGRPSVNRPQVDEIEIQDVLDYLDNAPLVGPGRGYDVDRLDPNGQQSVPVAFHTDGTWIWPAAVNYYLREHDISPEPDLVEHIRRMRFQLPQVDEQTRNAAQMFLGPPPPGPRPGPPAPAPTRAMQVPAPVPAPQMPPPAAPPAPPRAALPSQRPVGQELDHLRTRLDDLDVPETAYRLGPPNGRGWTMEQTDSGWRVGWHDRDWVAPAEFEDVADASAFLLGKLMLDTDRWAAGPKNPELPPEDHGFEPMSAPIDDFTPMSAPREDFAPAGRAPKGPVGPPPGTPGYASPPPGTPGYASPPPGTPGFTPPPSTPPRGEPAHTMAMDAPAHGLDSPGRGDYGLPADLGHDEHDYDQPMEGSPAHGLPSRGRSDNGLPEQGEYGLPMEGPGRGDHGLPADLEPDRGEYGEPAHGLPSRARTEHSLFSDSSSHELSDEPAHGLPARGRNDNGLSADQDRGEYGLESRGEPAHGLPDHGHDDHDHDRHGLGMDSPAHGLPMDPPSPPRGEPLHTMAMEPLSPPRGEPLHAEPPRGEPTVLAPRPTNGAAAAPPGSDWPINPLPGEPPLTLFRGKRVVELEPGTEIDRFGEDDGNLVYAAGTPFSERSLVPEWIDRPYHVYRVRQPVQVLTGAAIPWFDQPGGGTAYLLPDAIGDLVAHGHLVEVAERDRPRG